MLCVDTSKILGCLEMDDELLVEEPACELIYLRDQLITVIRYMGGIPEEDILSLNSEHKIARIKDISCWIPVVEEGC